MSRDRSRHAVVWYRCARHRAAAAGWSCQTCGKALCPDCVYLHVAGTTSLPACALCGGAAAPLTVHRARVASFASRLPRALGYPLSLGGLATLASVAAAMTAFSWFGLLGSVIAKGVYWAFLFTLVRTSSRGSADLEVGDFGDPVSDIFLPAARGFLATALLWLPALLYLVSAHGREALGDPAAVVADPVLWLIGAASVAYAPMAIMMAAMGGGFLQMLNPVAAVSFMVRLGADYAIAVGAIVLLGLADLGAGTVAGLVAGTGVPFVSAWAGTLLGLYFPAVMSRVLGLLLWVRGDSLDVGVPRDYLDPALPGVEPRGAAPARPALTPQQVVEAVDLRVEIAGAVQAGDLARAAALYGASSLPATELSPQVLFGVARGAAAAKDYPLAVRALRAAGASRDDPVAPRALLALGRIYGRKLRDQAAARRVLEHLLATFPESSEAREAQADLAADGS